MVVANSPIRVRDLLLLCYKDNLLKHKNPAKTLNFEVHVQLGFFLAIQIDVVIDVHQASFVCLLAFFCCFCFCFCFERPYARIVFVQINLF